MSGTGNIRWRESDLKELRRITKNYNAKIGRQREKLIAQDRRYEASQLPKKKSVREMRSEITSRAEFNREINQMEGFIKRDERYSIDGNTKRSLTATVRDFNAKVDRLSAKAKTQGELASLPAKISEKELIRTASSRDALVQDIKTYKGFLRRGAEKLEELPDTKHSIKITRWQKETMEAKLEVINNARAKELEQWKATQVKYAGKEAGYTQGQARMDEGDFDEFHPMNLYNYSSTYGDMREKFRLMMRESQEGYWEARTELARINYIEKMESVLGDYSVGKMLIKQIKEMPIEDFKRTLKGEDDLFAMLYALEQQSKNIMSENYSTVLQTVWNEWNPDKDMYEALDEYVSKQMKKTGV